VLRRIHLVRHGEVENPGHLVYADLPGFRLSALGRRQAEDAAAALAPVAGGALVVSSPLERALETAAAIAAAVGSAVVTDPGLTEWRLGRRWAGIAWEDLPDRFPGELEAYLAHPEDLPFSPESIAEVAARMAAVVDRLGAEHPGAEAILVSHQDPIQALRLHSTGRPFSALPVGKPAHCEVLTLDAAGDRWAEAPGGPPPSRPDRPS
jgi:broad specificity phosphatase PhoE